MIKGIATAASGMLPSLKRQEVITNNLANAQTAGFKRDRLFVERLNEAQEAIVPGAEDWGATNQVGLAIDFAPGSLNRTGNAMDVAISGDGFFAVQTPDGERYTRNGHFSVDTDGTLQSADGHAVLGDNGVIRLPAGEVSINSDGQISVDGRLVDTLRIVRFDDPRVLVRGGSTIFEIGIPTVAPQDDNQSAIRQGFLEHSNVNTIEEMVNMITTFRFYEADQRAIQMQDQVQGRVVNELGRAPA
ncbi:MAG: flagellar basal-body rod protein FlgF [candidate division Zixibacteria bacterium]|nr:flagellar basal-body rod protein FlgF [candidate division Zixibacteria bacterium]